MDPETPIPKKHTNIWQSVKMAKIFADLGYAVDVISWTNNTFIPQKNYSFFVDVRHNLQRLTPFLNEDCIKIMHLDTASIIFHNAAEAKRLLDVQSRRGITLRPRRFEMPNLGLEHADYATSVGNDFTLDTFSYSKKKIFKVPTPCAILKDFPNKNWARCRNRFLWFSSSGLVHKGLDLALEAFARLPDCHLTICAPVERDDDFVRAYYKELYETPNINTVGWVDVEGDRFSEITADCVAMLHLSCSEGGGTAVKTCMHAGLIPVVSYESGVDVDAFGCLLKDCSIDNVIKTVSHITTLSENELKKRARNAWETARRLYTRENFAREYSRVIQQIIKEHNPRLCT
ncbi:MAG TPA: glycosyltransferase family 1 protein [Thermodesulfobacteriaceae bacterium]|nr:glycosyltransferase family 1 protein [Thermodesulfobacteriaceae bacterium]